MKANLHRFFKYCTTLLVLLLLVTNCERDESISIQENFKGFEPIEIQEAQNTIGLIIDKIDKKESLFKRKSSSLTINESSLSYLDVENTSLSLPTFSASLNIKVNTKVFMVKKEGVVYTCLYHSIPFEDATNSQAFSGRIIITTIDGEFINGYKVEEGVFVSQYKVKKQTNTTEKTFSRDIDSSDYDCTDYGTGFCDQELDEVVVTSSGGGGNNSYSYIYIYTNPVSSQGWMNLNLSGNNTSGSGGGSNGGNGGSSNNGEMPLFPCDNPTPHGCEEEEEEIINELTGKEKCIYDKLENLNLFKTTIKKFENSNSYNLTLKYGSCNSGGEACTNADDISNGNITINFVYGSNNIPLEFAARILHEGIHAELFKYVDEYQNGVDPNDRPLLLKLYAYYKGWAEDTQDEEYNWKNDAHHQYMVENYVNSIAKSIRKLDGYKYSLDYYMAYGWDGLAAYGYTSKKLSNQDYDYYQNLRAVTNSTSELCD